VVIIVAQINFPPDAGGGSRRVEIIKNGTTLVADDQHSPGTERSAQAVTAFDPSGSQNDYYEVRVTQTSGGDLDLGGSSTFEAMRVY
jgi:hypothetical protein